MSKYKENKHVAELARAYQQQQKAAAATTTDKQEKLEECKIEMEDLVRWFNKEKANLEIPQMTTVANRTFTNPKTKRRESQSTSLKIIKCSDLLFKILEHRATIMPMIPRSMDFFKDNLHDLSNLDDALHLMQFMLVLNTVDGQGILQRCDPDPDHYGDYTSKDAQRPKNVVVIDHNKQIASSEGFLTFIIAQSELKQ